MTATVKKKGGGLWAFLLVLVTTLGLALGFGASWVNSPPESWTEPRLFTIEPGSSVTRIAEELERQGLLRSRYFLRLLAMVRGEERSYQVGTYEIPAGTSAVEIQEWLTSGRQVLTRVTIPEGWTGSKIARELEAQGITSAQGFLEALKDPLLLTQYGVQAESLEGLLYPDTYLFPKEFAPQATVKHMVNHFFDKMEEAVPNFRTAFPGKQWYDRVILASIVEKEYRVSDEAPLISSVFLNRIENRIPLGSCATVEYIITEIKKKPHPKRIFFADTEIPSPYNTYINQGLPPGPIANPGLTALKAAFNPPETDYIFFVVKDARAGTHTFSTNYRDHNEAREAYLAGFETKS